MPNHLEPKRFRVAFSFAGEQRKFVSAVANILAQKFGENRILYDKFHEAEFTRSDLGIYLPELYNKECDLVVVVICKNYNEKQWTGLEWAAIHDLLKKRKTEEILLTRFDQAEVKGLYSTVGFIELNQKTPEETAILILKRLAYNEGKPDNYYIDSSSSLLLRSRKRSIKINSQIIAALIAALAVIVAAFIGIYPTLQSSHIKQVSYPSIPDQEIKSNISDTTYLKGINNKNQDPAKSVYITGTNKLGALSNDATNISNHNSLIGNCFFRVWKAV